MDERLKMQKSNSKEKVLDEGSIQNFILDLRALTRQLTFNDQCFEKTWKHCSCEKTVQQWKQAQSKWMRISKMTWKKRTKQI